MHWFASLAVGIAWLAAPFAVLFGAGWVLGFDPFSTLELQIAAAILLLGVIAAAGSRVRAAF